MFVQSAKEFGKSSTNPFLVQSLDDRWLECHRGRWDGYTRWRWCPTISRQIQVRPDCRSRRPGWFPSSKLSSTNVKAFVSRYYIRCWCCRKSELLTGKCKWDVSFSSLSRSPAVRVNAVRVVLTDWTDDDGSHLIQRLVNVIDGSGPDGGHQTEENSENELKTQSTTKTIRWTSLI